MCVFLLFFFKQKTAYEMRISDWSSDVCSSDLDPLWRFQLSDAYNKLIDSPIADMKNVGPRGAGSITAAQFLQRFVNNGVKWAHLDIAGMVWADRKSVVSGKSVSVRVDLGGRRNIQKKNT